MATLIVKTSNQNRYLLDGGQLVGVSGDITVERMAELHVDDVTWANLIYAFGAPVYD